MTDAKKPVLTMPDGSKWEWVRWGEPRVGDYYLLSHGAEMHKRTNIQVDYKTDIYRPLTPPAPKKEKPPTLKELVDTNDPWAVADEPGDDGKWAVFDAGGTIVARCHTKCDAEGIVRLNTAALPVYDILRDIYNVEITPIVGVRKALNLLDGVFDE